MRTAAAVLMLSAFSTVFSDDRVAVDLPDDTHRMLASGTNVYRVAGASARVGTVRVHENTVEVNDPSEYNPYGLVAEFEVEEGKSLVIDRLRGGRGMGAGFVKSGEGSLAIGDGAVYGGVIRLQGGTLDLSRRTIPGKADLPAGAIFHLDASAEGALTTEQGENRTYVKFWRNEGSAFYKGEKITGASAAYIDRYPTYFRPWLLADALGEGRHVVDFGIWSDNAAGWFDIREAYDCDVWPVDSAFMTPVTGTCHTASVRATLSGVRTYIAVMGFARGGGTLFTVSSDGVWGSRPFTRGGTNSAGGREWKWPVCRSYTYTRDGVTETVTPAVYIDGLPVSCDRGVDSPGFHVVAVECDPKDFQVAYLGCLKDGNGKIYPGGVMLGEVMAYDRVLSDLEIRDCSAYLMKKWLDLTAPGYRGEGAQAELAEVAVESPSRIDVPAGQVARIGRLKVSSPLVKSGEGRLEVFELDVDSEITFAGGRVEVVDRPDVAGDYEVASGASLWLDPSSAGSLVPGYNSSNSGGTNVCNNGTNVIARWYSRTGGTVAYSHTVSSLSNPSLVPDALNALPVMFFGNKSQYNPFYYLGGALDGIRSVFAVWGSQFGGGVLMGSVNNSNDVYGDKNSKYQEFLRDATGTANKRIVGNISWDPMHRDNAGAEVWTNGVGCASVPAPSGDFQLVEIYPGCAVHASGLKIYGHSDALAGRGYLGEVIVYERELTEREKTSTRNYLMRKWFGQETPAPLPAVPVSSAAPYVPDRVLVDGSTEVVCGEAVSNVFIVGGGTVVKTGEGTLETAHLFDFTGTVQVAEGRLALTGIPVEREGALKEDGRLVHFDAAEGMTLSTNSAGNVFVKRWDAIAGSVYAEADNYTSSGIAYDEGSLNGLPTVKLNRGAFWHDSADSARTNISGVATVLWVLGSQEGGGFVLSGGNSNNHSWHRGFNNGEPAGGHPGDTILCASAAPEIRSAEWMLDGETVPPLGTGLSGGWDLLSCRLQEGAFQSARGFAMTDGNDAARAGNQRLAEAVLYDHRLDDEELQSARTYMKVKWGLDNAVRPGTNQVDIVLAEGAELDCGGIVRGFRSIGGGGAVVNGGVVTSRLVFDAETGGALAVEGTFGIGSGFTVEVVNPPAEAGVEYPIVTAGEVSGGTAGAKVTGLPDKFHGRVVRRDNGLYLKIGYARRFRIIMR